jgi:inorganic triphosphatase YgiF
VLDQRRDRDRRERGKKSLAAEMEVEVKLSVPSRAVFDSLVRRRRLGRYRVRAVGVRDLETIYLDTCRKDLLHRRMALRIRRHGRRLEMTIKLPGEVARGIHRRPEWTWRLARMPALPFRPRRRALRDRLPRALRTAELEPLVGTQVRRRALVVHRPGRGAPLAEIDLDRVEFFRPGAPRARSGRSYEIEVELLGGDKSDLERLVRALRKDYALKPSRESKFERALRWAKIRRR